MRRGEKVILGLIAVTMAVVGGVRYWQQREEGPRPGDRDIPFYTTAAPSLAKEATELIRREGCRDCHSLWAVRNPMQAVPAPALDGIGSLHREDWFYQYLSAEDPQAILPSRLKPEYRMPSYARLSEHERRVLAAYLASLKVKDWYLAQVKKAEYEKLTGKPYRP
ncbi:MAG: cytochrome c [Gammaproteobacteria bacterium]|nr:MAG: cytochrome c [Gammaproteobacteria bacterium]